VFPDMWTTGSSTVPSKQWLVPASLTPAVYDGATAMNPIKRYAVQDTRNHSTSDETCFPVVPFKDATSGAPMFNACPVCAFSDGKIDCYGCAACASSGHMPSDLTTIDTGTVSGTCIAPSPGAMATVCSPKHSQAISAVYPWDTYALPEMSQNPTKCTNLAITVMPIISGAENVRSTFVNVGCSFWKLVSCVGVWSVSASRWEYKCGVAKKSNWLYVDTCAPEPRSAAFDWTDSSTHGSSTCPHGPRAGDRGNSVTSETCRDMVPQVLTTYSEIENFADGQCNYGHYFPRLVKELSNGLCGNTVMNR